MKVRSLAWAFWPLLEAIRILGSVSHHPWTSRGSRKQKVLTGHVSSARDPTRKPVLGIVESISLGFVIEAPMLCYSSGQENLLGPRSLMGGVS